MANSNFVTNTSVFTPFTYEEIAAPLREQTQLQMAIEDAYSTLGQNAGAVAALLNPQNDARSYNQYINYMNALNTQAEDIARSGLNAKSRSALMALNSKYATDILPIQKAYENRAAEIKRAQELSDKDPTRLLSYNPSQRSVDDYLLNPNMSFESRSGALLAEEVAQQVKPIADVLRSAANYGALDSYTKIWLEDRGLSPEEIQYAIDNPNQPGVLQGIVDRVIATSGIDNWGDEESSLMARYYAQQGLWQAIGKDTPHAYEDYGSRAALQDFYATRRARLTGGNEDVGSQYGYWRQHRMSESGKKKDAKLSGDLQALMNIRGGSDVDNKILSRIAKDNGMSVEDVLNSDGTINQDGFQTLTDKVAESIKNGAMLRTESELYLTDYSNVADTILGAVNGRVSKGIDTGFKEYGKDKYVKEKDVKPFINSDMRIFLNPEEGWFIVGQNKDGESRRFSINPEIITGQRRKLDDGTYDTLNLLERMRQDYINSVNERDYDSASDIYNTMGQFLHSALNSKGKIQSNTDSKL